MKMLGEVRHLGFWSSCWQPRAPTGHQGQSVAGMCLGAKAFVSFVHHADLEVFGAP